MVRQCIRWDYTFGLALALLLAAPALAAPKPRAKQDPEELLVYRTDFNSPQSLAGWNGPGRLATGWKGTPSLCLENNLPDKTAMVKLTLPQQLIGQTVTVRAMVKGERLSGAADGNEGIHLRFHTPTQYGSRYAGSVSAGKYPSSGSFDWLPRSETLRIPSDAQACSFVVSMPKVTGRLWIDNLEIAVRTPPQPLKNARLYKGHDQPRLRGVLRTTRGETNDALEDDVPVLAQQWRANQMEFALVSPRSLDHTDQAAYDAWLEEALTLCDKALELCRRQGIYLLVSLHSAPGGRDTKDRYRLFSESTLQKKFLDLWERIAKRYRGQKVVYAYDLLSEPIEPQEGPGVRNWFDLATEAAERIRVIDPDKAIVFQPGPWGEAAGFDNLRPLPVERVVYCFHHYKPHSYTHQGVGADNADKLGTTYPGVVDYQLWNKDRLRESMQPALDFQRRYRVQIYVGEFSVARWAPGGAAFLRDSIDLFEEYGWDWSYHYFRAPQYNGWDAEFDADRQSKTRSPEPTDRLKVLLAAMAKNERPDFRAAAPVGQIGPPPTTAAKNASRTWTDVSGQHHVEARFEGLSAGQVRLRKADDTLLSLPLEKLSAADQQWIPQNSRY